MKYDKNLNTKQIYEDFLPLSYDLMDEIYENLQKENAGEFKKIIKMQKEAYITSVNKKENKQGESELSSIFNVIIVIAANTMVTIQKRTVIFDSWNTL